MFDPENVERYREGRSGMEKLSEAEIASAKADDVYVKASAYDQLVVFYRAVRHSPGHIDWGRSQSSVYRRLRGRTT